MRAFFTTLDLVHHRLEQAAKNGGGNRRPIKAAGVQQGASHIGVEGRGGKMVFEEAAVDIGKAGKIGINGFLAIRRVGVQHIEQLCQL